MPVPPRTSTSRARRGALPAAALLLAAMVALALAVDRAPAQSATSQIESKLNELGSIDERQGDIKATIDAQNAQVNDLIARESEVRRRESAVQAELDRVQAELNAATEAFNSERAHLRRVRTELERAVAALEELLVRIYMSAEDDTATIVLDSDSWSDLLARSEYLDSVKQADDAVVEEVRELEDEIAALVVRLRETRERIAAARDEVAARRQELSEARAEIEARHAELAAAQAARRQTLAQLEDRQEVLEDELAEAGVPTESATLLSNGDAVPPSNAPLVVKAVIEAANRINDKPYIWGGGHGSFEDDGYDCSGAVSYALHGGGLMDSPLDSTGFTVWGEPGAGSWITIYAYSGHMYAVIAGLRFDTGGPGGGNGPRWSTVQRSPSGFVARHPAGL
jgi:peptidoglycan hydrolase CwlO-like protein